MVAAHMKLSGAFYPALLRMAPYKVQLELGCDPEVLRYFSDSFILSEHEEGHLIHVFTAEPEVWKETERTWRDTEYRMREANPNLH